MGGDGQPQTHVQLLHNIFERGMAVQPAIDGRVRDGSRFGSGVRRRRERRVSDVAGIIAGCASAATPLRSSRLREQARSLPPSSSIVRRLAPAAPIPADSLALGL